MTNATQDTIKPEQPQRQPGRAARIAAIHMFADWLVAHPDVPVPTTISATHWVNQEDEQDESMRRMTVELTGERLGATLMRGEQCTQSIYRVAARDVHGVTIDYAAATMTDEYYAKQAARWRS